MLGRTLGRRLAASAHTWSLATSTSFVAPRSSLLTPAVSTRCAAHSSPYTLSSDPPRASPSLRWYATARAAPKQATSTTKTTKKTSTTRTKPKAKSEPKSKAKAKPTPKPKPKPKPKPAAKKKKQPARKKKETSPESALRTKVSRLRKIALTDKPKQLPASRWLVYVSQVSRKGQRASTSMPDRVAQFRALPEVEVQRLQDIADQNKVTNERTYHQWVHSHPIVEVRAANNARSLLNKIKRQVPSTWRGRKPVGHRYLKIKDDRAPKRPLTGYMMYLVERRASGDFRGSTAKATTDAVGKEWRSLSGEEQKKYHDAARPQQAAYAEEFQKLYPGRRSKTRDAPRPAQS